MTIECPPLYSVWENDKGGKIFVEQVIVLDDDEFDGEFFVTVVPYKDRDDMEALADELDQEQWADLIKTDGIRMTGIEPQD
ncbi:hypothetical protein [Caballeronia sp. LZ032]|uniref:hypothetical protein n=1 Tax=Caballeronia sp. LZ032 TaxID=3038565 RepID=UPI002859D083|nr:hypothetical protein [Caballeronia sp. LZ032]MDR5883585.1 hypothetical protein [Caballeronia sp. LZ032]